MPMRARWAAAAAASAVILPLTTAFQQAMTLIMISVIACWKAVVRGKITAEAAAAAAQRARIGMKSVEDALSCAEISSRNLQFYVFSNDTSGTFAYLSV